MALDQAANFVREGVTSAISAGDTTINVADASPFPVPPEGYNIVVWDGAAYVRPDQDPEVEIMRVTDTDTTNDTLTVARGQEGTSDVSHPDTSVVVVAQTAKMIADIASEKISNPVTETIDANNNDVTNVGALDADSGTVGTLEAGSVNTADATITQSLGYGDEIDTTWDSESIADDSSAVIQSDGTPAKILILNKEGRGTYGLFLGNFGNLETAVVRGMSNEGNSTLTGTTGPDDSLNIAHDGGDLTVENRTGIDPFEVVYRIDRA